MRAGVTIVDPASTWIDADVTIGPDTEIWPGTHLEGRTVIGEGAKIGPACQLRDTTVARRRHGEPRGLRAGRDRAGRHRRARSPTCGRARGSARARTSAATSS